jgi:hypothetical protein
VSDPARVADLLETPDAIEIAPELHVVPSPETPAAAARWWRIADFGVFAAWIGVVAFTLRYHEKWADEAQALADGARSRSEDDMVPRIAV